MKEKLKKALEIIEVITVIAEELKGHSNNI